MVAGLKKAFWDGLFKSLKYTQKNMKRIVNVKGSSFTRDTKVMMVVLVRLAELILYQAKTG